LEALQFLEVDFLKTQRIKTGILRRRGSVRRRIWNSNTWWRMMLKSLCRW
jgi:hypothetical protein